MKIIKIFLFSLVLIITGCNKKGIGIAKIERDSKNNQVNVYIQNNTNQNYYIIFPQCQIDNGEFFFHGSLNPKDYNRIKTIDTIVKKVYGQIQRDDKSNEISMKIVLLPSKKSKKLNFIFNRNIDIYKTVTIEFPFNIPHKQLKGLNIELKNVKLYNNYNFYSGIISTPANTQ